MMEDVVIITKVLITRQGERKHFQIRLPKDAKYIIGIEYGVRLISRTVVTIVNQFFKRNILIGEFKLQSCEESNWFYSANVYENDSNLSIGDVSSIGFPVNDFSHGSMRFEEEIKVEAESTIIQAWFKDSFGESQQQDTSYEVSIYVWIKTEEEK